MTTVRDLDFGNIVRPTILTLAGFATAAIAVALTVEAWTRCFQALDFFTVVARSIHLA